MNLTKSALASARGLRRLSRCWVDEWRVPPTDAARPDYPAVQLPMPDHGHPRRSRRLITGRGRRSTALQLPTLGDPNRQVAAPSGAEVMVASLSSEARARCTTPLLMTAGAEAPRSSARRWLHTMTARQTMWSAATMAFHGRQGSWRGVTIVAVRTAWLSMLARRRTVGEPRRHPTRS